MPIRRPVIPRTLAGVIVVIGSPVLRRRPGSAAPEVAGLAGQVAMTAADAGGAVQLVGKVGDDEAGDSILAILAAAGVAHAAVLRDAANATPVFTGSPVDEPALEDSVLAEDDDPEAGGERLPPALSLDTADVALALRYLTDFRVVVVAERLERPTLGAVLDAAGFAGAHVIRLDGGDALAHEGADGSAAEDGGVRITAFQPPARPEPAFSAMIGRYAAGLDAGREPREAFAEAARGARWERAADD